MRRATGIMLVATMVAATLTGCALRDVRGSSYSQADGLWGNGNELIDWNFPTSQNQGPIEVPQRLRPERTAIGVTWATYNPWPRSGPATAQGASQAPTADGDDGATSPTGAGPDSPAVAPDAQGPAAAARGGDGRH